MVCAGRPSIFGLFVTVLILGQGEGTYVASSAKEEAPDCQGILSEAQKNSGKQDEAPRFHNSTTCCSPRLRSATVGLHEQRQDRRLVLPMPAYRGTQPGESSPLQQLWTTLPTGSMVATTNKESQIEQLEEKRKRKGKEEAGSREGSDGAEGVRDTSTVWHRRSQYSGCQSLDHNDSNTDHHCETPFQGTGDERNQSTNRGQTGCDGETGRAQESVIREGCHRRERYGSTCRNREGFERRSPAAHVDAQDHQPAAKDRETTVHAQGADHGDGRNMEEMAPNDEGEICGTRWIVQGETWGLTGTLQGVEGQAESTSTGSPKSSPTSSRGQRGGKTLHSTGYPSLRFGRCQHGFADSVQLRGREGHGSKPQESKRKRRNYWSDGGIPIEGAQAQQQVVSVSFDPEVKVTIFDETDRTDRMNFSAHLEGLGEWDAKPWALYGGHFVHQAALSILRFGWHPQHGPQRDLPVHHDLHDPRVPGGDPMELHHEICQGEEDSGARVQVLQGVNSKRRQKVTLHTFGLQGGYLGRRSIRCEVYQLESEGEIRRILNSLWSDFDNTGMTFMWPTPQPPPEAPGKHKYLVVDFLDLSDELHRGRIAVLCDVKGWIGDEQIMRKIEATMLSEWETWNQVVDNLALTQQCVQRFGHQCIMRIGTRLVLDDEPFLVPDDTLVTVNFEIQEDTIDYVSLMQRAATGSSLERAYHQVVNRRTEIAGEEAEGQRTTYHLMHRTTDYIQTSLDPQDPFAERRAIAAAWGVTQEEIIGLHPIRARPEDIPADGSQLLITRWQRDDNYKTYEHDVQVLYDVEVHSGLSYENTPKTFRHVDWSRRFMTRQDILFALWVQDFCRISAQDRCLVWINNVLWPLQQETPKEIHHGDYIRVAVPGREGESTSATRAFLKGAEDRARDHRMFDSTTSEESEEEFEGMESETSYGPPASVSEPEPHEEADSFPYLPDYVRIQVFEWIPQETAAVERTVVVRTDAQADPQKLAVACRKQLPIPHDNVCALCRGCDSEGIRVLSLPVDNVDTVVLCKLRLYVCEAVSILWIPALATTVATDSVRLGSVKLRGLLGRKNDLTIVDNKKYQTGDIIPISHSFSTQKEAGVGIERPGPFHQDDVLPEAPGISKPRRDMQINLDELIHGTDFDPCGHGHFQNATPDQGLDFRGIFSLWQWLDAAIPTVGWTLPEGVHWHQATTPWVEDWWDLVYADQIYIYTDGSAHSKKGKSAAAAVFFVRKGFKWYYAGHLRQDLPGPPCPHRAELHGILLGLHWLNTTLHRLSITQWQLPAVHLAFDATSAGYKAFGQWGGSSYAPLVSNLRALCYFIEFRYGIQTQYEHIYGHTWHPGNEAANTVASYSSQDGAVLSSVWSQFFERGVCEEAQWLWAIWKPEWKSYWQNGYLFLPKAPLTKPNAAIFMPGPIDTTTASSTTSKTYDCVIATANVLTLLPTGNAQGLQGRSRLELLQEQFYDHGCHIVGIQESRHRKVCRVNQKRYYVFSSPATPQGQYGVQIWIAKDLQLGESQARFDQSHFKFIARDPRRLILKVCAPFFRAILVCGHAPTSQSSQEEIGHWWEELRRLTPEKYRSWPHVLLLDGNARVGSVHTDHIGDHHPDLQDGGGEALHDYLCEVNSWLPSTFEQCHVGESGTWYHPKTECWGRGDYIGLPGAWSLSTCTSYIPEDIDLSLAREDHRPLCAKLSWSTSKLHGDAVRQARPFYDLDLLRTHLQGDQREQTLDALAGNIGTMSWGIDVHTHTHHLQNNLRRWLDRNYLKGRQKPQRRMSEEAWEVVCEKRQARLALYTHRSMLRQRLLRGCFAAWRGQPMEDIYESAAEATTFACNLNTFRRLGCKVTAILRREDKRFFDQMAAETGAMDAPSKCKEFWARIKGALPRVRNKSKINPLAMEALDEQWVPHFSRLEAGRVVSREDLLNQCIDRSPADYQCHLHELPTRCEIENTLRSLQAGKAPGPDGLPSDIFRLASPTLVSAVHDLYSKAAWWASEPLQAKGGLMLPIHKRGNINDASSFRGVMLLNVLSKAYHKWLRSKVVAKLDLIRMDTQIGGFPGQQATFGAHSVQTVARLAHAHNRPMACLFVDIQGAYHFLVRELVVGAGAPEDAEAVVANLEEWEADTTGLNLWLKLPGLLERARFPPRLVRILREVHQETWAVLPHLPQVIRTARGSRPGSPLADIIYAALMCDLHIEVHRLLEQHPVVCAGYEAIGISPMAITWADDLAIPLAMENNEEVIPVVSDILASTYKAFERRGLLLNMNRGKTVAVLAFRGPQAPKFRKDALLVENPGTWVTLDKQRRVWLHFGTSYKHLGSLFVPDGEIPHEISNRIGQAKVAYNSMRRILFGNRYISVKTRLQLLESLIISRLCYGLSTWGHLPPRACQALEAFVVRCQRYICGYPIVHGPNNDQLYSLHRLPTIPQRLAVARISYAARLWSIGPSTLQDLLLKEAEATETAWWNYLKADLDWCRDLAGDEFPVEVDDTEALCKSWKMNPTTWIRIAKKALRKGVLQEAIAADARIWHRRVLHTLHENGATTTGMEDPAVLSHHYPCHCGRVFTTPQGLAAHKRFAHGYVAPETTLVQGLTHCPACLRHLWTEARVKQHLSYIPRKGGPNRCYQSLVKSGFQAGEASDTVGAAKILTASRGINRRDAIQACGPLPAPGDVATTRYEEATRKHEDAKADFRDKYTMDSECDDLQKQFSEATATWFAHWDYDQEDDKVKTELQEAWLTITRESDLEATKIEAAFLQWGRYTLVEIAANWWTGVAERLVEEAFYEVVQYTTVYEAEQLVDQLASDVRNYYDALQRREDERPHRAVRLGPVLRRGGHKAVVPMFQRYLDHDHWHKRWKDLNLVNGIPDKTAPMYCQVEDIPTFLVLHLFAGRRRHEDFHAVLAALSRDAPFRIHILSLDTAIDQVYGNLGSSSCSWAEVLRLLEGGKVAAGVAGSPCETFSSARYWIPPEQEDEVASKKSWPRPLRDADRPWGLPGLTSKELKQLWQGSQFAMQTLLTLAWFLVTGGCFISEHPFPPKEEWKVSVFRTPLARMLLQFPEVDLKCFYQGEWGASSTKPTGLMTVRLPRIFHSMWRHRDPTPRNERSAAIGVDECGKFKTAKLKEYPKGFSAGLSQTIFDELQRRFRQGDVRMAAPLQASTQAWLERALFSCSAVRDGATMRPDYQPET